MRPECHVTYELLFQLLELSVPLGEGHSCKLHSEPGLGWEVEEETGLLRNG